MDLMSKNNNPKTAIIGGGAAGFFLAINLKELSPEMDVTIFERSRHPLAKVEISGGGRCNCTNSFEGIKDLKSVYPRGHRLMKRLFHGFNHQDAYEWFERHGVKLMTQSDHCVFPEVQDSHAIINMFMHEIHRHNIKLEIGKGINSLDLLGDYDYIVVTTGGTPRIEPYQWLKDLGHTIELPVPSLFSLSIADPNLNKLMGIVCENAVVHLEGTKYREQDTLLITHWGVSGPAVLRLSSHAARYLHDVNYKSSLCVNWTGKLEAEVRQALMEMAICHPNKVVRGNTMFGISQRLQVQRRHLRRSRGNARVPQRADNDRQGARDRGAAYRDICAADTQPPDPYRHQGEQDSPRGSGQGSARIWLAQGSGSKRSGFRRSRGVYRRLQGYSLHDHRRALRRTRGRYNGSFVGADVRQRV